MAYAIWILSFLVGIALVMQDGTLSTIGWVVIVAGALVGYRIGKRKDEDRQARKITEAMRDE